MILIPSSDHSYRLAEISKVKVVYNTVLLTYSEYVEEEFLQPDEITVEAEVAE